MNILWEFLSVDRPVENKIIEEVENREKNKIERKV